jgi:MOSC domain-containing protein YiiM
MFGENLTTRGLTETSVRIGDRFRISSTLLTVTQPRSPCYKLGIKLANMDMVGRFLASGRSGFYFAVNVAGEIGAGDLITLLSHGDGVTVADAFRSDG